MPGKVRNAANGVARSGVTKVTKADISRERVLAAAAKIFVERGYAGTTMRAIADDVGLKAGSLYYHFPSKELLKIGRASCRERV